MFTKTEIACFIGGTLVLVSGMTALVYFSEKNMCLAKYADHAPTYGFTQGCLIQVDTKTYPAEKLQIIVRAHE